MFLLKAGFKIVLVLTLINCYYKGDDNSKKIIGRWKGVGTITTSKGITKPPENTESQFLKSGIVIEGGPNSIVYRYKYKIVGDTIFWFNIDGTKNNLKAHIDTLTETRLAYKFVFSPVHIDYHYQRVNH